MKGMLYIDGQDAFIQFGIYVAEGGYDEIIAMPPLKIPESNDWQEEDGIEIDLENQVLNSKIASVKFAVHSIYGRPNDFIIMLADRAYHEFKFATINRTYKLRMIQVPNMEIFKNLGIMTIKFSDDFPLANYEYLAPEGDIPKDDSYMIDGIPTTDYNIRILQGSLQQIIKPANIKIGIERNIKALPGIIYDEEIPVTYKSKDVKITCLIRASNLETLWRNYDALLYDLIRPQEHTLSIKAIEQEFPFCYKQCSVSEFFLPQHDGRAWLKFALTLTIIHDFRINDDIKRKFK